MVDFSKLKSRKARKETILRVGGCLKDNLSAVWIRRNHLVDVGYYSRNPLDHLLS